MSLATRLSSPSSLAARSPARPCRYIPSRQASACGSPLASSAVRMPVSTSPLPAVAMPAFPVELNSTWPSGRHRAEWCPFNIMYICSRLAMSMALASRSKLSAQWPDMRSNSLGCGVMIMPWGSCWSQARWFASRLRASASATMGHRQRFNCAIRAMAALSDRPRPGPMPSASKSSVSTGSLKVVSSRSGCTTASGTAT